MEHLPSGRVRFGDFVLDFKTGELCSVIAREEKTVLREQPFQVLQMLIHRDGKLVTREEIRRKLWPNSTIADFDHSINVAIGILRKAVGDSAGNPKYVETLARRGYGRLNCLSLLSGNPLPKLTLAGWRCAQWLPREPTLVDRETLNLADDD